MGLELVNVVAGGTLDVEIDLYSAFEQIGASDAKYHLTGADSFENAREAAGKLTEV